MGQQANILLVDDHQENLTALEAILNDLGHNLVLATSGEEALRQCLKHDFAVIILDVMMPTIDGFETASLIRQRERSQFTPIIFLTAIGKSEEQMRHGYELGGVDYLLKPFVPDVLRWKVAVFADLYLKSQAMQHLHEIQRLNQELEARNQELKGTFARVEELYSISRRIGKALASQDVLEAMISSSFLSDASLATIFVFDRPWVDRPPKSGHIEAFWRRDPDLPDRTGMQLSMEAYQLYGVASPEGPVIVEDVTTDPRIQETGLEALSSTRSQSFIQFPLIASGLWFGSFAVHWDQPRLISRDDVRHIEGLVDQAAAAVYSLLLLRAEAKARQAAETADALKLKFLAMISHELRTPLTSIKGFATTLLQPEVTWDAESQHEFVEIINYESDNLANLVEQLLDMTSLQAGTLAIDRRAHRLADILSRAMPQIVMLCEHHNLEIDVPEDLPLVNADAQRIVQVLTNLVSNACRYSEDGTCIRLSGAVENGWMRVDVADQGPGIPLEEREAIFEAFRQAVNRPVRTKGVGLGLAIARGIVEAHGGTIWVSQTSDTGTMLSFTLPLINH